VSTRNASFPSGGGADLSLSLFLIPSVLSFVGVGSVSCVVGSISAGLHLGLRGGSIVRQHGSGPLIECDVPALPNSQIPQERHVRRVVGKGLVVGGNQRKRREAQLGARTPIIGLRSEL